MVVELVYGGITLITLDQIPTTMEIVLDTRDLIKDGRILTSSSWESKLVRLFGPPTTLTGNRYFEVQVEVGEAAQGWVFWTWKVRTSCAVVSSKPKHIHSRLRMLMNGAIRRV